MSPSLCVCVVNVNCANYLLAGLHYPSCWKTLWILWCGWTKVWNCLTYLLISEVNTLIV